MNLNTLWNRVAFIGWLGVAGAAPHPVSAGEIDDAFYTNYNLGADYQSVWFETCSSIENQFCGEVQTLSPFGRIGAMVEGFPTVKGNAVSRRLYIVDVAAGADGTGVLLMVYSRVDLVTASGPVTTLVHEKTLPLPLVGGPTATGFIAGNRSIVVVGTDQNGSVVSVRKGSWDVLTDIDWGDGSVTSITSNDSGFIIAKGGDQFWKKNPWFLFNPNGTYGGIVNSGTLLLNSTTGISTRGLYTTPR